MTEDEAKTKACPLAATFDASNTHPARLCIGSACMAWRWERAHRGRPENSIEFIETIRDHRAAHNSTLREAKDAVEAGWRLGAPQSTTSGFCGLAGRPE